MLRASRSVRPVKCTAFLASLFLLLASFTANAQEDFSQSPKEHCVPGLHMAPKGPFAVMVYCEDALGNYLSVVYAKPIGAPSTQNGKWTLVNRHWSERLWSSDFTGYKWSADGLKLIVGTSGIYGSGGLFELDLLGRISKQLLPKDTRISTTTPGPGYLVDGSMLEQ